MGLNDDQIRSVTPRFQGKPDARNAVAEHLISGNISDEFGMLAQVIAETRAASPVTTTALQNTLAGIVHQTFREPYEKFLQNYQSRQEARYRPAPSMPEFYARNPLLFNDLLGTPVEDKLSMLSTAAVPAGFSGAGKTMGELYPRAFNASTVQGVMGYLSLTELPSVWQQVSRPLRNEDGEVVSRVADLEAIRPEFMAGVERAYETMPYFDPSKGGNFAVNWSAQASKGIRAYREGERMNRGMSTPISWLEKPEDDGDDRTPGYTVSGETGEWMHDDSMDGAEGMASREMYGAVQSNTPTDLSNYSQKSAKPTVDYGNYAQDIQSRFRGSDLKGQEVVYDGSTKGFFYAPEGTQNVSVLNPDPNSAFVKGGGQSMDTIRSFMRVLQDPNLDQYVAAIENGTPINLSMDRFVNGKLTQIPLSINGDFQSKDVREPNWVERLAGQIDPEYKGNTVVSISGKWEMQNGQPVYKSTTSASPIGATTSLQTFLWTDNPDADQGMKLSGKGNWSIPNLTRNPGANPGFDTPVRLTAPAVKAFGAVYGTWGKAWNYYRDSYDQAWAASHEAVTAEVKQYYADHLRYPKDYNYDRMVEAEFNKRLPADVPRPGSQQYQMWQNGEVMLKELRDIEKAFNGSVPLEAPEMSIEAFDALASSLDSTVAKDLYNRKFDNARYAQAQKELSSAGTYLLNERKARYAGVAARLNPGDKGELEYPAPDGMGDGAPVNGSGGAPLGISQARADRALNELTAQFEQGALPAGMTNGTGGRVNPGMLTAAGSRMLEKSDLNNSWRFQPGSMTEDDWHWTNRKGQPSGFIADDPGSWLFRDGGDTVPIYNLRTKRQMNQRDAYTPTENTYDNSLLGGNPDALYEMTNADGNVITTRKIGTQMALPGVLGELTQGQVELRADGKGIQRAAYPSVDVTRRTLDSTTALNSHDTTLPPPGRVWATAPGDLHGPGIDEVNEEPVDDLIRYQQANTPRAERMTEVEENSSAAADYSDEQRHQRAMRLIPDPESGSTDLPSQIAAEVAAKGAYRSGGWAEFFETRNKSNPMNASSYRALTQDTVEMKGQELRANLSTMVRLDKKENFIRTRLGEDPVTARAMANGKGGIGAQYYRETLKMISDERKLGLDLEIGNEAHLYDQVAALAASENPEDQLSYQAAQGAFAPAGDQLKASRGWIGEMGRVSGAGMSIAQARPMRATGRDVHEAARQLRAASHTNVAPRGRSQAKWSAEDQLEMRHGRGRGIDPLTGEFDPLAMENTPVAAHLRAADPAGGGGQGERPQQLSKEQRIIHYPRLDQDKVGRQVGWFMENEYSTGNRSMFNFIVPAGANEKFLQSLHEDATTEFEAHGMTFGAFEELDDPTLPAGYRKIGGYVDPAVPTAPPPANGSGNNGNGGQPPVNTTPPTQPNPAPKRNPRPRRVTSLDDNAPGRDPANWPATPQQGMTATWTWDGKSQTAYAVEDGNGGYVWAQDSANGPVAMPEGPAFGRITDNKGNLLNQITYGESQRYAFEQKVKAQGLITPAPQQQTARQQKPQRITRLEDTDPGRNPANWPATPPGVGYRMDFTRGKQNWSAYGEEINGQLSWVLDDPDKGPQVLRENPGYGRISDPEGNLRNFVSSQEAHDYAYQQRKAAMGIGGADPNNPIAQGQGPNTDAANWPAQLQAGWTLETRDYGKSFIFHAMEDAENPGKMAWFSNVGGNLVRRQDPGYGVIRDENDQVIHQVTQLAHEREAVKSAKQFAPEPTPQPQSTSPANNRATRNPQGLAEGPELVNLNAENPGASVEYNRFARSLGGVFARDHIQKSMEYQRWELGQEREKAKAEGRPWNEPDSDRWTMNAYKKAFYSYANKVSSTWESLGSSVKDFTAAEAAAYLMDEFGVEENEVDVDENGIPQSGPLRAAGLIAADTRKASPNGRFSETTRLQRAGNGRYIPTAMGATIDQVLDARRNQSGWLANTLAVMDKQYTPGNILLNKRVGMLGHIQGQEIARDTYSVDMEELDRTTGEMIPTATHNEIEQGMGIATQAFTQGASAPLPNTPNEAIATLRARTLKVFNGLIDGLVKEAEKTGLDPTEAAKVVQGIKQVGYEALKYWQDQGSKAIQAQMGDADYDVSNAVQHNAARPHSRDKARELVESSNNIKMQTRGQDIEKILNSGEDYFVTDDEGHPLNLGDIREGSSAGNYRGGPRGGSDIWGRKGAGANMGGILYGAYMMSREWKMAVGEPVAQATAYGQLVGQFAPQALGNMNAVSAGAGGALVRDQLSDLYNGQAAYSVFGGFNDVAYMLAGRGPTAARVGTELRAAGGITAGTFMGMNMLGFSGALGTAEAGAAVSAAAMPVAAGVGLGLLGVTGVMEAYNAIAKPPEGSEATFGNLFRSAGSGLSIWGATDKYLRANGGGNDMMAGARAFGAMAMMKFGGGGYSADEMNALQPYMSEAEWDVVNDKGTPEPVRKMFDKATHVMRTSGEDEKSVLQGFGYMQRAFGELTDQDYTLAENASKFAVENGMNLSTFVSSGMQYAENMGAEVGSEDYKNLVRDYMRDNNKESQAGKTYKAGRLASLSAQWQSTMAPDVNRQLANNLSQKYGFDTQAEQSALVQMTNALQSTGVSLGDKDLARVAQSVNVAGTFQSNVFAGAVGGLMQMGSINASQGLNMMEQLSGAEMVAQDASVYQRMMGGDLKAYSYQAWQSGNLQNAFFDRAGRSIMQYQGATALGVYNHWAPQVGLGGGNMTMGAFLGTGNQEIISAFSSGGMVGLQQLANEKSYAASMASAGIAMKGIGLQENFYWGKNQGGTWDNPASHSAWGIEDRQIAMQDASQRANFADQWTRMTMQNDFSIKREDNQIQRMNVTQGYQDYQWSYSYNQFQQSQVWAQADWQSQDTMRNLNFSWNMEDLNEQIRFSSGRQRRQLVKQRDRTALTENLQEDQIETSRDRQKELWAQQEEQFQKQKQYNEELQRLDQESFALNKDQREQFYKLDTDAYDRRLKEYEEEKKLQEELRELQRKFQYDQLQLSKESAGAQAAAAAAQYEINKAMAEGQKKWEEMVGTVQQMNEYNNAFRIAVATSEMMKMMDNVNTVRIDKLIKLIQTIGTTTPDQKWGGERD